MFPEPTDVSNVDFTKLFLLRTNRILYNWSDNENFPAAYGICMVMPCPDSRFSFLFYTNGVQLWIGSFRIDETKFYWHLIG